MLVTKKTKVQIDSWFYVHTVEDNRYQWFSVINIFQNIFFFVLYSALYIDCRAMMPSAGQIGPRRVYRAILKSCYIVII